MCYFEKGDVFFLYRIRSFFWTQPLAWDPWDLVPCLSLGSLILSVRFTPTFLPPTLTSQRHPGWATGTGALMHQRISASFLRIQHICIWRRSSIHFSLVSLPWDHAPVDGVLSATGSVFVTAIREPGQVVPAGGAYGLSLWVSQH